MQACHRSARGDPDGHRADAAWAEVRARYAEPQRHYHTLIHVAEVADVVDRLLASWAPPLSPADRDSCLLAAVLHDVVYDPRSPGNEAASAALARRCLGEIGLDPAVVDLTARLIESTADHAVGGDDAPAALLNDADLSILGQPAERYDDYREAVRREYAHLTDEVWRAGRSAVLDDLLARPRLFVTDAGRRWYDDAARRNMARERAGLSRH